MDREAALERFLRLSASIGLEPQKAKEMINGLSPQTEDDLYLLGLVLSKLDDISGWIQDWQSLECALWLYFLLPEQALARRALLAYEKLREAEASKTFASVVARHINSLSEERPTYPNRVIFCDLLNSIYATNKEDIALFERWIRDRNPTLPEREYVEERIKTLRRLFKRIFKTEYFRKRYEAAAKTNLRRLIAEMVKRLLELTPGA